MFEQLLKETFFALWFFAPSGIANMAAFFSGKIDSLKHYDYPVDFYLKYRGKRILGSHKTIRGFVIGIIAGIIVVWIQIALFRNSRFLQEILYLNYASLNPIILGFLAGFGALAGDSVKSFFKRQKGIIPGQSWVPFDQIDYIIGGIAFTWLYIHLKSIDYIFILILWIIIHPFTTFIAFLLKLKRKPL